MSCRQLQVATRWGMEEVFDEVVESSARHHVRPAEKSTSAVRALYALAAIRSRIDPP